MSEIDWSKAPEGATHYHPDAQIVVWYRKRAGNWECFSPEGYWRPSVASPKDLRDLIPRPTQWRDPEDGLPPVGTRCKVRRHGGWAECEIIAHVRAPENRIEAVYQADDDWDWLSSPTNFRPLKSDKDRAIDAAVAATILKDGPRIRAALSDIYDAGLLRLPEEQS